MTEQEWEKWEEKWRLEWQRSEMSLEQRWQKAEKAFRLLESFNDELYPYEDIDEKPAKQALLEFFNIFKEIRPDEKIFDIDGYYDAFETLIWAIEDAEIGRYAGVCSKLYEIAYCHGIRKMCESAMYSAIMRLYYNILEEKICTKDPDCTAPSLTSNESEKSNEAKKKSKRRLLHLPALSLREWW